MKEAIKLRTISVGKNRKLSSTIRKNREFIILRQMSLTLDAQLILFAFANSISVFPLSYQMWTLL